MGEIQVTSEVGRLRRVLVHEPGPEVDRMVPAMMEGLLFDDILFGDGARDEHRRLRRIMQLLGVEVLEAQDLLSEVLASAEGREWILRPLLPALARPIGTRMRDAAPAELASMLVSGVRLDPLHPGIEAEELFEVPPLPNWCFQRDPQLVIGSEVVVAAMATPARWREGLLAGALFRYHPALAGGVVRFDPVAPDVEHSLSLGPRRPHFEGGDLLVLSPEVVAVGFTERTNRTGVRQLARLVGAFEGGPRWLVVVKLPHRRAYMHLDTVITPVDRDLCLVYPPMLKREGSERMQVFEFDLEAEEPAPVECADLLSTLRRRGVDLEPLACGGSDPVEQQREQWTDGANALALAPGVIVLFDRNVRTVAELDRAGFRVIDAEALLLGREELDLETAGRTCILLPSHELSRARGGPHCLTHALSRAPLA